ncbi:PREDICTED: ralBP1-associated Eps domain-containing protein 2 [Ceratosolen solmsi marchali]|uniref:RalBP1-associated Eps domain-containing protein 2 n=1 Tax=Ceratosolen solmsi marchali TaxID=326594 RepID=A0AAJ7DXX5_9HYME|nr:PREDICTED: ralBP1-associated Eps domain-containing protein 2 [Ceratosolen solmsi marchali]
MADLDTITISSLKLNKQQLSFFKDMFKYCCKNADTEVVPTVNVIELLKSAWCLPLHARLKILDICGVNSKTMNRKQFYSVLKLLTAHQCGSTLHKNLLVEDIRPFMPIPRFAWDKIEIDPNLMESDSEEEYLRGLEDDRTDSPTPTNSVTQEGIHNGEVEGEVNLDSFSGEWQSMLISEEQRQLLATEEESSERHSSDDDSTDDGESFPPEQVWVISDEQRIYYTAQFRQLQPDLEGHLAGSLARKFFEKSRLPVEELRRIWQLSDVTRDSALSLREFHVAMHLAVLRRNNVPLPEFLPATLAILLAEPENRMIRPPRPFFPPKPLPRATSITRKGSAAATATAAGTKVIASTTIKPKSSEKDKSKEWTKFVDSPTGASGASSSNNSNNSNNGNNGGSLASPGPKPVNFDFQKAAVERDPKILHPVPLRLTPEAMIVASNGGSGGGAGSSSSSSNGAVPILGEPDAPLSTVTTTSTATTTTTTTTTTSTTVVQRPLSKKPVMPPADEAIIATPKKEPPPPPPPRPYRTHTRSSSLDLNKLGKKGQHFLGAPPLIPPRVSPGITTTRKLVGQKSEGESSRMKEEQGFVADFSQFAPKAEETQPIDHNLPSMQQFTGVSGAFHIYKKPSPKRGNGMEGPAKDETDDSGKNLTLQELREKNAELRQVCEELTRELAAAVQERIHLKAQFLLLP